MKTIKCNYLLVIMKHQGSKLKKKNTVVIFQWKPKPKNRERMVAAINNLINYEKALRWNQNQNDRSHKTGGWKEGQQSALNSFVLV